MTDPVQLLDLALEAAHRAGELLLRGRPADLAVAGTKSSPTDVVTEMDTASEQLIVSILRKERPDDGFLGEEEASSVGRSGVRWVIDPLDGTVNYLYDLPGWAVSIAAEIDGVAAAGVVAVPSQGEVFSAVRGAGAFCNGLPIRCRPPVPLAEALVATGFGYTLARRTHQAEVVSQVLPHVRDIRRLGACAADLCAVACGRVDAYYERGVQHWDIAAGALIAAEAGADVAGLNGEPPSPEITIAAPAGLFGQLHDLLAGLDPLRD